MPCLSFAKWQRENFCRKYTRKWSTVKATTTHCEPTCTDTGPAWLTEPAFVIQPFFYQNKTGWKVWVGKFLHIYSIYVAESIWVLVQTEIVIVRSTAWDFTLSSVAVLQNCGCIRFFLDRLCCSFCACFWATTAEEKIKYTLQVSIEKLWRPFLTAIKQTSKHTHHFLKFHGTRFNIVSHKKNLQGFYKNCSFMWFTLFSVYRWHLQFTVAFCQIYKYCFILTKTAM